MAELNAWTFAKFTVNEWIRVHVIGTDPDMSRVKVDKPNRTFHTYLENVNIDTITAIKKLK